MVQTVFTKISKNTFLQNTSGRLVRQLYSARNDDKNKSNNLYVVESNVDPIFILFLQALSSLKRVRKLNLSKKSRLQMFVKISVLKNFGIITRKHLCRSLF